MNEVTIPSSPTWYLSNILACNDEGTSIAYGAKHELVVLKVDNSTKPCAVTPSFIPFAHKDKINAVAFAPSSSNSFKDHLVSCSDDGTVKVWDLSSFTLIFSHSGHPEDQKLPCVDWSRADPNLIVSVSDLGSTVCWDLTSNTIRKLFIGGKIFPLCLACCPHSKESIAIGAKGGLVIIYNIKGDGHITFRIRGHESDVISLAWCPVPYNVFRNNNSEKMHLLASGSKDKGIYFWRAGTDGRFETHLSLPSQTMVTSVYRNKNGVGGSGNCWVCVRWPLPNMLLVSSQFGELLSINLQLVNNEKINGDIAIKKNKSKPFKLIHGQHTKGLFSIATSYDLNNDNRTIWTCALDKHIVGCNMNTSKIESDITTIGGYVYCLAASPFDPNRLAVGTGDSKVLIWNMSNGCCSDITTFWNKINSKVMALSWHPSRESILAFSTGEGRIGLMDVSSNKPPTLLRLHHRRSVYSLIWGPPLIKTDQEERTWDMSLFSVGDGEIFQYELDYPDKEPTNLNSMIANCDEVAKIGKSLGRSDLSWNHDRSLAAIGNENGLLYIVNGANLCHIHSIFAHKKLVQCVVWHPKTVTSENTVSLKKSWLATAADNIQVFNITEKGFETVATLTNHTEKVVSLAWSPHFSGRLFSASYDYTCQVWDVTSASVISCYDGHHNTVLCCLPSPLHPDIVITGSSDCTLRVWNINKYKGVTKPKSKKARLSDVLMKFSKVQEASDLSASDGSEYRSAERTKPESMTENSSQKRKNRSLFSVTSGGLVSAKHLDILWSRMNNIEINNSPSAENLGYLDFFGDTKAMNRLLMVESSHHRATANHTGVHQMALWSGDIAEVIKEASKKKQLNDWLVSLAPMVSHKVWVECCTSYAYQLAESGDHLKASSYFLVVHKIEEAVNVLIDGKLMREAVALAKSRLSPSDPTVIEALTSWASQTNSNGMLSLSAHCLLNAGKTGEAIECLSRCKDANNLALAAKMADRIEAFDMSISLALRSLNTSLAQNDYTAAKSTLDSHPTIKDLSLWVDVCNLINEQTSLTSENALCWLVGQTNAGPGLFEQALELVKESKPSYDLLLKHLPNKPSRDSANKVWLFIAGQITLAVAAQIDLKYSKEVFRHLLCALNAAYNSVFSGPSHTAIYLQFSAWMSPKGPLADIPLYESKENSLVNSVQLFIRCGAIYWIDHLKSQSLIKLNDKSLLVEIYRLLKLTAAMILTKDVMAYFKNGVEIKRLENSIAAAKLNISSSSVKYCTEIEAMLCNQTENSPESNLNVANNKEETSEPKMNGEKPHELPKEKVQTLAEMKEFNHKFEEERSFTPNPFVIYCCIKNFVESSITQENSKLGNETLSELRLMWSAVSNEE